MSRKHITCIADISNITLQNNLWVCFQCEESEKYAITKRIGETKIERWRRGIEEVFNRNQFPEETVT